MGLEIIEEPVLPPRTVIKRTIKLFEDGAKKLRELGFPEEAHLNDCRASQLRRQQIIETMNAGRS